MAPRRMFQTASLLALCQSLCTAQTFIPKPYNVTFKESTVLPGGSLSYKETEICDTTPGVKSYSGHVTVPVDNTYNASIFFWYFESRNDARNAPTTIWMPGGPGASFLAGGSGFPCSVNADGNSTSLNPYALNSNVNMLYFDIPVQTGYSYTELQNGTFNVVTGEFTPGTEADVVFNSTTTVATLGSADPSRTANTTQQVARQMWQLSQIWFQEFPEWHTENNEINLWSYSYSGFLGPASVAYAQQQNELIANGSYTTTDGIANPIALPLGTLGSNNGCIDVEAQMSSFQAVMFNNTYGIKVLPESDYAEVAKITEECYGLVASCRAAAAELDPHGTGAVDAVNALCANATYSCFVTLEGLYLGSNRSEFDVTLPAPGDVPNIGPMAAFYNQRWVQEALGVPVNFTYSANSIVDNFFYATGDPMIPSKSTVEYILDAGIDVAFVYGDRDYQCNWIGIENVSLSLDYAESTAFRNAGYAALMTNASYQGGLVRQHNGLSFSRVFQAGHSVADYQPQTVLEIFERAIFGKDVATGLVDVAGSAELSGSNSTSASSSSPSSSSSSSSGTSSSSCSRGNKNSSSPSSSPSGSQPSSGRNATQAQDYSTTGPLSVSNVTNTIYPPPLSALQCGWYVTADTQVCNDAQIAAVEAGTAVVVDWVVVSPAMAFYATSGDPTPVATAAARRM
ncbi:Alpha/Beta hydrolase protein [Coniella lustricola]|uniref:Alpha/Beta hydrolase protein n=1 Tax=Coniella lustricola TaxID=2025994 RepID=A0A2T3AB39_9PEZI|nr:Alpha/Beta hydrolase protein [Coniella lustricola]